MSDKLFESNWQRKKDMLCEGHDLLTNMDGSVSKTKKSTMAIVLENTRREMMTRHPLMETATAGGTSSGNIAILNKVILPVIRRVMPTVIANEIIGIQPMTGPVAQIHTLRVRYSDNSSGVTPGTEALSPFDIARAYSGNENAALPMASATAVLEGRPGNRLDIQILKETVQAKTGLLSLHKIHKLNKVLILKLKLWLLWLKKLLPKLTKKFCLVYDVFPVPLHQYLTNHK